MRITKRRVFAHAQLARAAGAARAVFSAGIVCVSGRSTRARRMPQRAAGGHHGTPVCGSDCVWLLGGGLRALRARAAAPAQGRMTVAHDDAVVPVGPFSGTGTGSAAAGPPA